MTQQWPAWDLDLQAAGYWGTQMSAAVAEAIAADQIAEDYLAEHDDQPDATTQAVGAAVTWLAANGVVLAPALQALTIGLITDGYLIGAVSATAVVNDAPVDTGTWQPGDTAQAQQLIENLGVTAGLSVAIAAAGTAAAAVAASYVGIIASAVVAGHAAGHDAVVIAAAIRSGIAEGGHAAAIALDHLSAAIGAAAKTLYRSQGVMQGAWLTEDDAKVCAVCLSNQAASPLPLDAAYPSGDTSPPAHPGCRCALIPAGISDSAARLRQVLNDTAQQRRTMPKVFPSAASVMNLKHKGKTDWYRIEDKAGAAATQVHIYDEIGLYGVQAGQFIQDLNAIKGNIELHLSTPGGEVFDGLAIYAALKNRTGVTVIVDSIAASIGSVIAMGADPGKLFMEPTAQLMIHDGFAMAAGNAAELTKMVEQLNTASDTIAGVYASRTGQAQDVWRKAMMDETWYTAEEAVTAGLADGVVGTKNQTGAILNQDHADGSSDYLHDDDTQDTDDLADLLIEALKAEADTPPCKTCKGNGRLLHPKTGKNSENCPACDGTGKSKAPATEEDDTTEPENSAKDADTDDDEDAKKPFPGAAKPFKKKSEKSAKLDYTPWNAAKAWHDAAQSANPAETYAGICAGRRKGNPDVQSSWALPYRFTPESLPNAHAVAASLGKLQAANIVNAAEAQMLLLAVQHIADQEAAAEALEQARVAVESIGGLPQAEVQTACHDCGTPQIHRIAEITELDTSAWNPAAAFRNASGSPDPAEFYAGICAGRLEGEPELQSSWALPYRYVPDGAPNVHAAADALERINTVSLVNTGEAKALLESVRHAHHVQTASAKLEAASKALAQAAASSDAPALTNAADPEPWAYHGEFPRNADEVQGVYTPAAYRRSPAETTQCPSCQKFNGADARHCDQCGIRIVGRNDVLITNGSGLNGGRRISMADVDNSAWNASRAWHNGATSPDPASFYKAICAGTKDGDKSAQSAWALPYKYHPGDPPNAAGVRNALARVDQTQGLTNKAAAQALLEGLMKKINPDYEPSDDVADMFRSFHTSLREG